MTIGLANGMVPALTLDSGMPNSLIAKDRSRIARYSLLLCGTVASGEILRLGGGFFSSSDHSTSFAKPWLTFSSASAQRHAAACAVFAKGCAPLLAAAVSCSIVHALPQSTGQPKRA